MNDGALNYSINALEFIRATLKAHCVILIRAKLQVIVLWWTDIRQYAVALQKHSLDVSGNCGVHNKCVNVLSLVMCLGIECFKEIVAAFEDNYPEVLRRVYIINGKITW